jgi:hypothetical protein
VFFLFLFFAHARVQACSPHAPLPQFSAALSLVRGRKDAGYILSGVVAKLLGQGLWEKLLFLLHQEKVPSLICWHDLRICDASISRAVAGVYECRRHTRQRAQRYSYASKRFEPADYEYHTSCVYRPILGAILLDCGLGGPQASDIYKLAVGLVERLIELRVYPEPDLLDEYLGMGSLLLVERDSDVSHIQDALGTITVPHIATQLPQRFIWVHDSSEYFLVSTELFVGIASRLQQEAYLVIEEKHSRILASEPFACCMARFFRCTKPTLTGQLDLAAMFASFANSGNSKYVVALQREREAVAAGRPVVARVVPPVRVLSLPRAPESA